jgi:hypothetical protein
VTDSNRIIAYIGRFEKQEAVPSYIGRDGLGEVT